ncbi:MAG: NUDIX domain-containing protein [Gammaproteobacteria bacterium]
MHALALVCARCQPPGPALGEALDAARSRARRVLLVVLNADDASSPAQPLDNATRGALLAAFAPDIELRWLRDRRYDPQRWCAAAEALVADAVGEHAPLVFADAGEASTSLPLPPAWRAGHVPTAFAAEEAELRALLFEPGGASRQALVARLPAPLMGALDAWRATPAFARLAAEAAFLRDYRERWWAAPFPPVFVTVDSVVTWRDQVLLIERGQPPGVGQWALPGGFIDLHEPIVTACLRELGEETGLALRPADVVASRVFDDPLRSQRGRTITHAYRFVLDHLPSPPLAVGGDDAAQARWTPIAALDPARMFDDHYFILQTFLGLD